MAVLDRARFVGRPIAENCFFFQIHLGQVDKCEPCVGAVESVVTWQDVVAVPLKGDFPQPPTNRWFKWSHDTIDTNFCCLVSIGISYRPSEFCRINPNHFWEASGNVLWDPTMSPVGIYVTICWYHCPNYQLGGGQFTHNTAASVCPDICADATFSRCSPGR